MRVRLVAAGLVTVVGAFTGLALATGSTLEEGRGSKLFDTGVVLVDHVDDRRVVSSESVRWAPKGLKACAEEDSIGPCYWNGKTRGDGKGPSFIAFPNGPKHTCVVFIGTEYQKYNKCNRNV